MRFVGFSLQRYRAFDQRVDVDLAPLTIVLGRNHSGKTTLCRAPWFVSQPFDRGQAAPFPFADPSLTNASSLLRVARGISGFEAELRLLHNDASWKINVHASAHVDGGHQPILARLRLARNDVMKFDGEDVDWSKAQQVINENQLDRIHEEIGILGGFRDEAKLSYPLQGFMPSKMGFRGEEAPQILAATRNLGVLNQWSSESLNINYEIERDASWDSFRVIVNDGRSRVLLAESGTGLVQVLPVAAAILLLPRLPALYCIEHPELHLHPHAHRTVAELLIQARKRHPNTCFLVETHSDTLVLRLRRAIVEKRLDHRDIRLLYVDRDEEGSTVKPIFLNERGVPDWWPKGVFSEAHDEFSAMRRKLNESDAR